MNITVHSIPHRQQRYDTCGDWQFDDDGNLNVYVSAELPYTSRTLIALHEIVEAELCLEQGIDQKVVDDFDMNFDGEGEPGDHPHAPYRHQHCFAEGIERLMCAEIGITWKTHVDAVNNLRYD